MSYPPQQPGSPPPPTGPFGPPPPPRRKTVRIVLIAVAVVLAVAAAGIVAYALTRTAGSPTAAPTTTSSPTTSRTTASSEPSRPSTTRPESTEPGFPSSSSASGPLGKDPESVVDAYVLAYQTNDFGPVTQAACSAYKEKYGTDTSEAEEKLEGFTVTASADGAPDIDGDTASAKITLELVRAGERKTATIEIKIVEEAGEWKFCGEQAA